MSEFDVNFHPSVPSAPKAAGLQPRNSGLEELANQRPNLPTPSASVWFSPSKGAFLISGREVSARDEAGILQAAQSTDLNAAFAPPTEGDWKPKDTEGFRLFVDKIANPDLGRRFAKNFESATASMGVLAGAGMKFAGAEDAGQGLMDISGRRVQELSPYEMGLEDINGSRSRGVLDWFAGVVGQFGPSIVESAVTAAIGAGAGALAGGGPNPFTATGGALAALSGKQAVKQALLKAAEKQIAGETLDVAERKLLQENAALFAAAAEKNPGFLNNVIYGNIPAETFGAQATKAGAQDLLKRGRTQAIVGGAGGAAIANSYALGVSDVYREGLESGAPDRGTAALFGIPYAALDVLPEFLLARRVFGDVGADAARKLVDQIGTKNKAAVLLKRGTKGFATGALLEGGTEAGQEALLIAANPLVDWNSPEAVSRVLNSFAAGAAIGGPIGSLANLADNKEPANLLQPTKSVEPEAEQYNEPAAPAGNTNLPAVPPSMPGGGGAANGAPVRDAQFTQPESMGLPRPIVEGQFTETLARPSNLLTQQNLAVGGSNPILQIQQRQREPIQYSPAPMPGLPQLPEPPPVPEPPSASEAPGLITLGGPQYNIPSPFQQRLSPLTPAIEAPPPGPQTSPSPAVVQEDVPAKFETPKAAKATKLKKGAAKAAPKIEAPAQRTVVSQKTTRSPHEGQITEVTLSDGNTYRIQKTTGRGGLTGWFDLDRNEVFDDGYLGNTKAEAIDALLKREPPKPEPPKPTKTAKPKKTLKTDAKGKASAALKGEVLKAPKLEKGAKGNALKAGEAAARSSAPQAARSPAQAGKASSKATRAGVTDAERAANSDRDKPTLESERKQYDDAVDAADIGDVDAIHDLVFFANAQKDEVVNPELIKFAKEYLRDTVLSAEQQAVVDQYLSEQKKRPKAEAPKSEQTSPERSGKLERLLSFLDEFVQDPDKLNDRTTRLLAQGQVGRLFTDAAAILGEAQALRTPFNGKTVGEYITIEKDAKGRSTVRLNIVEDDVTDTFRLAAETDMRSGNFFRADGQPAGAMPHGDVRLKVKAFVDKLFTRPKTYVYKNLADFKAQNPNLFAKAKAARPQGDFENTEAVGYAFDETIIIFSDYVRTEEQLRFVLAHETIGHFGLRAVLGSQLNKYLDHIYAADKRVRSYVDMFAEMRGQDKHEAIEEFLADYAAEIDSSLLTRIWAAIKNALNKLGVKFDDDMARLVIGQARKYVREGQGGFFSAQTLAETMATMQQQANEGRFSAALNARDLGSNFLGAAELAHSVLRPFGDIKEFVRQQKLDALTRGQKATLTDLVGRALEAVQTLDNKATRSEGLTQMFQLFQGQGRAARAILSDFNRHLKKSHDIKTTEVHKEKAGKLLAHAALYRGKALDEAMLDRYGKLIARIEDGKPIIDEDVLKQLSDAGFVSREEFLNGFEYPDSTGGMQSFTLEKIGLTREDVAEGSRIWEVYEEQRQTVNRAAAQLLISNYEAYLFERKTTFERINRMHVKSPFTDGDREAIRRLVALYEQIANEGAEVKGSKVYRTDEAQAKADKFLIETTRAFDNEQVLKDWQAGKYDDQFGKHDGLVKQLEELNKKGLTEKQRYTVQNAVRNLSLLDAQVEDAERFAKRTILGSYVPFKRRGRHQVRLAAYTEEGKLIALSDEVRGVLPYYRDDSITVADQYVTELDAMFGNRLYKVKDADGNTVEVTFKAERSEARQTPDFEGIINYNEFVYVLQKMDISITPKEREKITEALTAQNHNARTGLQRTGNPGWDKDVLRSVAEYLEMMSHVAAKRIYQARIGDVMQRDSLWVGNDNTLRDLKHRWENTTEPMAKARAKRELETYAYKYRHMKAAGHEFEIDGKKYTTLGQGERYREDAKALLHWYAEQTNINDSTEDGLQGPLASRLKTAVVFAQLGGTVATAAVNAISLLTHTLPTAAYYNPEQASGFGFGMGKSAKSIWSALNDMKNVKLGDIDALYALREAKNWDHYNLTEDELDFLIRQTESGPLQAVLPDALLGTARGKITNPYAQKASQLWMSMFSYTEKLNRRVSALAIYRMEKERAIAEGLSKERALASAEEAALRAVDQTQGEYAQFNRPRMARGNIFSYVFMYKMFPIITVQLLRRLPLKGKLTMLGMILLLSGLKGVPFADDIMDLLDTLLQKLGIKIGSVEADLYEMFDSILPGSGTIFMRGGLDQWTGATFSTRLGTGDLIPLTGAFKAGADPWREAQNFMGPMAGGLFGFVGTMGALGGMGVDLLGGRPSNTNLIEIMRQSPVALGRAIGDALVYADNGAVVNSQGRVVTPDVGPMTLLFRALGFYPASATRSNDMVRVSKQARDYMLEVSKSFKDAYVRASLTGDKGAMKAIEQQVGEWNTDAKGTGLEIKNFRDSVQRAIKEAKLSASARFLKTTPLGMRDRTAEWMRLYGADQ